MRRLGDTGTDVVTFLHKLAAVVWFVSAAAALVLDLAVVPSEPAAWDTIVWFVRAGAFTSVATLSISLVYAPATPWGFARNRLLLVKWVLYLVAVSASGYSIRAAREQSPGLLVVLAGAQVFVLAAAVAIGVNLHRTRCPSEPASDAAAP